ncbi:hypothetical protein [Microbacterium phage MO526]|uniref:Uncharacterized protein n=1 Tax=Microbacterium phage MO526 TaxID=3108092 RepID=A0ABZ0ZX53_9CAUD|nr:hypothetical protein [Microbacterium phage MO526]
MRVRWEARPSPGTEGEPAEGVIEALDLDDALAEITNTYPSGYWAVTVAPVNDPID